MGIKDLGGLSEPLTKLIHVVSSGIGTLYSPRAIKKGAKAKAYEIKTLAKAEAEASEIQKEISLQATSNRIASIAKEQPELAERAKQRLLAREIEGQLNIEEIANHAALALPQEVSAKPVSSDWRRKFFLEAENVCDEDIQSLWGKVLAGEIAKPGSFSLRTLDVLKRLSRSEAEMFQRACRIAMSGGWIALPDDDLNIALKPYEITYGDILVLRDAGLMRGGDFTHKTFPCTTDGALVKVVLPNNHTLIEISGPAVGFNLRSLLFSNAGTELQSLIEFSANPEYFRALGQYLRSQSLTVKISGQISQDNGITVISFDEDL